MIKYFRNKIISGLKKRSVVFQWNIRFKKKQGSALMFIIVISAIGAIILTGLVSFIASQHKNSIRVHNREQSFQAAEAGIYWYRWYLAHNVEGQIIEARRAFWESGDAKGVSAPYEADVVDPEGGILGRYRLEVTPPQADSTVVTVKSTGWTYQSPNTQRVIQVRFRQPAWCEYAVVADDFMRFGEGTEVFGMIHSNQGIRFDGLAHNIISSHVPDVDDPDHSGDNEFGVHTHINPPPGSGVTDTFRPNEAPPNPLPDRSDVFLAGRKVSQPEKNFNSLISDFRTMKDQADSDGLYLGQTTATVQFNCRNVRTRVGGRWQWVWTCDETAVPVRGYHITLKTSPAHSMDVSMVLGFDASSYEISPTTTIRYNGHDYTIQGELAVVNYPIPSNGIVFVENNAWVEGTLDGDHLTIAAADLAPIPINKDIYINHDILYTDKVGEDANGPDILGLIAQGNVSVGLYSDDNLEIDAALLAQKGRIGRNHYSWPSSYVYRDTITVYGSLVTKQRYGFAWTDGTGYENRDLYFDNNLMYFSPPYFPAGNKYQIDSWNEM